MPIEISDKQLTAWKRMLPGFIWKGFKPQIKYIRHTLQLPKEKGGLSYYYYYIIIHIYAKHSELLQLHNLDI